MKLAPSDSNAKQIYAVDSSKPSFSNSCPLTAGFSVSFFTSFRKYVATARPEMAKTKHAKKTTRLSLDIQSMWRQSNAPQVIKFIGTRNLKSAEIKFSLVFRDWGNN